jgi:hypothetical protein
LTIVLVKNIVNMYAFTGVLFLIGLAAAADQPGYEAAPANYQFQWGVLDSYSGNDFGQEEARSGYNTDGEYSVVLPDGRKQIVTYKVADGYSGYVADVRYEGEAQEYNAAPRPAYAPVAPAYHPVAQPSYHEPAYATPQPAYRPQPVYTTPKPVYRPEPVYTTPAPAYRPQPVYTTPKPLYRPEPVYTTPAPAYRPQPVYTTPEPVYRPEPVYTTPRPAYNPQPAYRPRPTYAPLVASASTVSPQYYLAPEGDAPTYNPETVVKRRMQYPTENLVHRASSRDDEDAGLLFYGAVKGRVNEVEKRA